MLQPETHDIDKSITRLIRASSKGDIDRVIILIQDSTLVNGKDQYQFTPLIWACRKGHLQVVKALIDAGANKEIRDLRNRTAFFHAVTFLKYEVVSFLAEKECNVNPVDIYGWTPLDFALTNHNTKVANLIKKLGASSNRNTDQVVSKID